MLCLVDRIVLLYHLKPPTANNTQNELHYPWLQDAAYHWPVCDFQHQQVNAQNSLGRWCHTYMLPYRIPLVLCVYATSLFTPRLGYIQEDWSKEKKRRQPLACPLQRGNVRPSLSKWGLWFKMFEAILLTSSPTISKIYGQTKSLQGSQLHTYIISCHLGHSTLSIHMLIKTRR